MQRGVADHDYPKRLAGQQRAERLVAHIKATRIGPECGQDDPRR